MNPTLKRFNLNGFNIGRLLLFASAAAALWLWYGIGHQAGTLKVVFLDVGQGDCAVIESPSGKVMLIDTGGIHGGGMTPHGSVLRTELGADYHDRPSRRTDSGADYDYRSDKTDSDAGDDEGHRTVEPFLRSEGINHIDTIVLTHPHADHIGGAPTLIDDFPIDRLIDNGADDDTDELRKVLTEVHNKGVNHFSALPGETLDFQDGVFATIIAPTPSEVAGPINDASVVVRIQYGRTSFLFTGDAEAGEEETMVRSGRTLRSDVLKVGHHGSHTSSTPLFLSAVHPRVAVISVGRHNSYGHPSPDTIGRLQSSGINMFRTDRNGAVTCISDSVDVTCNSQLPGG